MSGPVVGEVMTHDVQVVRRDTSLREIARRLTELRVSALPVLDDEDRRRPRTS